MDNDLEFIDLSFSNNLNRKWKRKDTYVDRLKSNALKTILNASWLIGLFIYLETVFQIWAFDKITAYFILKIFMCFPTAIVLSLLVNFFPAKVNKIVNWVVTGIVLLIYGVHIVYHAIFKVFFSFEFIDKTNTKVVQYYRETLEGIKNNWVVLFFAIVIPVVALILINRFKLLKYEQVDIKFAYIPLVYLLVIFGIIAILIPMYGDDEFSAYELVKYENTSEYSVERLGVVITNEIQIRNLIKPRKVRGLDDEDLKVWVYDPTSASTSTVVTTSVTTSASTDNVDGTSASDEEVITEIIKEIDTSPNILNIDFVSLAENESNDDVASIHKYMASLEPTYKNEYTGMFAGYNLILLTAEGFSRMCVDETHTPTLYKLVNEGFVFNNFYNPRTGGSTSDGEFVVTTSLCPSNGGAKNYKIVGQNAMPFSMGNIFNRTYGIQSRAYHDNDYQYYGRDISYPSMGYYYQGVGNGVVVGKHWPESDLEMMQSTIPEYIDDDVFNIYYMTVSGHLNYNFTGNYCAKKHYDEVQDLPYSDACKAYIACNMELDKAMEYLIEQLEEKGIADRTVICFTGDHWPYGLTNEEISEILGHKVEEEFELYKSNLILWSGSIKEPIVIDKYCCSMDIIPTLLNLFGFDYDSRLYMGRDILSNTEGFVGFMSRSFITDKVMYNARTKEVTYLTDEEVSDEYIQTWKKAWNTRWNISSMIMDYDYYQYIADSLGIKVYDAEQNYTPDYSRFTR